MSRGATGVSVALGAIARAISNNAKRRACLLTPFISRVQTQLAFAGMAKLSLLGYGYSLRLLAEELLVG